ncbi:hypothetical protein ACSBR2_035873 [Camellia fascicularis]
MARNKLVFDNKASHWLLWSNIVRWWGMQWVLPGSVNCLLHWWSGCEMMKLEKKIWKVLPLAILWSTWKHRNECVFSGSHPNLEDLCELVKIRVAMWLKASPLQVEYSIYDLSAMTNWLLCYAVLWFGKKLAASSSFKYAYVLFCWLILECSALLLLSGFKDVGFKLSILTCPSSEACSLLLYCCCYWFLIAALVVAALLVALLSCFSFFLVLVAFDWFLTNLGFSASK